MSQKFEKLKSLLKELFQLDRPDLDFGIYRIMHARSAEVSQFLEKDLLPQVKAALATYRPADKVEIKKELDEAVKAATALGVDPEQSPKVRELKERYEIHAVDLSALEADVYDHLFRFFRRYYSEGDFISKRVYKEGVYAIPYEGEEVKLYWANHDQYYIKTSEYLRDYAFRLRPGDAKRPMRVHFRLVDAREGAHGNVKESNKRVFVLAAQDFIAEEDGELVIRFEYRPATLHDWPEEQRRAKTKPPAQKDLNTLAEARVLGVDDAALARWIEALRKPHVKAGGEQADYSRLRAHLNRYTARNTFDYFIHKDLGGFLRRELDFYIKNEVMHLDDVESQTAPRVEQYLSKIKVIRRIAHKIIDFLAQLEDFQKKLWLKKKFVTETSWCIRLGVIPEAFYDEIAANDAQREEWVRLHAIDEIEGDLVKPGYTEPLSVDFLKAHPTLMIDSRHFDAGFTARLLEALGDVDEQTDGVLFHSENFQALSLMQARYRERFSCIYIDPPYNTEADRTSGKFVYKDSFERSSWLAMMTSRMEASIILAKDNAPFYVSIDEHEYHRLVELCEIIIGERIGIFTWVKKSKGSHLSKTIRDMTEFVLGYCRNKAGLVLFGEEAYSDKAQPLVKKTNSPKVLVFPEGMVQSTLPDGEYEAGDYGEGSSALRFLKSFVVRDGKIITGVEVEGPFVWTQNKLDDELRLGTVAMLSKKYGFNVLRHDQSKKFKRPSTLLNTEQGVGTNENAFEELLNLTGIEPRGVYPKPVSLIAYLLRTNTKFDKSRAILDYFAGSGTTGHAVINLNREDGGRRRFILVEMGDYFDTVLLPRLKKVTFTPEWKNGKPKRMATEEEAERSPRLMKVVRLESYEDTLNNLELKRPAGTDDLFARHDRLREDYLLRYMLEVESRGSPSLLNIKAFTDPTAYRLKVKVPGSDESRDVHVDLMETFHWLIGLTVAHVAAPRHYTASFKRDTDPDLPKDAPRRLLLEGRLQEAPSGRWWFRTVEGVTPDGRRTLVIWRNRPGGEAPEGMEQDNLVLDEWFKERGYSSKDSEFDLIYVNGDNNLENLKRPDDTWKVRLIEEDFHGLMFETEGV